MKRLATLIVAALFTTVMAFGQNNTASTSQNGNSNTATTAQTGSENDATVLQGFQGQGQSGAIAIIDQVGATNAAIIKQRAWGNRSNEHSIKQTGTFNEAKVDAFNGDNLGEINQDGSGNGALMQHGAAIEGQGYVIQNGDDNQASHQQFNGAGNTASIIQGAAVYTSSNNEANLTQRGNSNNAMFSLTWGDQNKVTINQDGDHNYSQYGVKYGDLNTITADVEGNSNRTRLYIQTSWGDMSSGNTISVTKNGDFNYVSGKVEGSGNTISLMQNGYGNKIGTSWYTSDGVNIAGSDNTVSITQQSDFNSAFTSITGSGNTATISQN